MRCLDEYAQMNGTESLLASADTIPRRLQMRRSLAHFSTEEENDIDDMSMPYPGHLSSSTPPVISTSTHCLVKSYI